MKKKLLISSFVTLGFILGSLASEKTATASPPCPKTEYDKDQGICIDSMNDEKCVITENGGKTIPCI